MQLAQMRFVEKKFPEGQAYLEQVLANNPNELTALRMLVGYDVYQHQPDKAIERVQQQIAKSPQNSALYSQLADLEAYTKNGPAALSAAEKAMQLNPNDGSAVLAYTRAQVLMGNVGAAINKWQAWRNAHPNDVRPSLILGSLEEAQGNMAAATSDYKKALAIDAEQPVAANNLAYIMLQTGDNLDVALSLAQTARRAMPNSPNTADTLAWAYYMKGVYYSAKDLLTDALKTAPDDATLYYHLGMTEIKLGHKPDAIEHLKKAASLAPNTQTATDANKALAGIS
jgi:cellulose synthase operon protein C